MTIVFKVSNNVKKMMMDYYQDLRVPKTPPYALFQANEGGTIITLYNSSKVVFQGISADIDANMWIDQELHLNNRNIRKEIELENKKKEDKKKDKLDYRYYNMSTVGSDEVGTGDYFGPIVVTASFVPSNKVLELTDLGVRDSKKLTDEKMLKIGPELIKNFKHVTIILNNKSYNEYQAKGYNMNKIKAILHNKVLTELLKEDIKYEKIIVDQFVYPKKYYEHIKEAKEKTTNITFLTHAEDVCLSVAVSSIISRYIFLKEMDKLSKELKTNIPKGASTLVDEVGKKILDKYGIEKLKEITKYNFKNTAKIKGE
ncbi:MAG TPA: ribonuclease HIII [Bacilli bacterium]|nr:ribonuclease HIII [Bacilli bacterium]